MLLQLNRPIVFLDFETTGLDVTTDRIVELALVRLNPDGSLFIGADGKPSYYAPGHGDFFRAIRISGVLERLRARYGDRLGDPQL